MSPRQIRETAAQTEDAPLYRAPQKHYHLASMRDRLSENTLHAFMDATWDWKLSHRQRAELALGPGPGAPARLTRLLRQLHQGARPESLSTAQLERCLACIHLGLSLRRSSRDAASWMRTTTGQAALDALREMNGPGLQEAVAELPAPHLLAYANLRCSQARLAEALIQAEREEAGAPPAPAALTAPRQSAQGA